MSEMSNEMVTDPFIELVGEEVVNLIFEKAPRKVSSRIGKSLDHYNKSLTLIGIDEEMGAIRLIAAEEELVVSIFEWIKLNIDKIPEHNDFVKRFKNHRVKLAFYPVLSQIRFALSFMITHGITLEGLEDSIHLSVNLAVIEQRVALQIKDPDGNVVLTQNPLSLAVSLGGRPEEEVLEELFQDFKRQIEAQSDMAIGIFINQRADFRNKLLYADDAGFHAMGDKLEDLIHNTFRETFRDMLWCIAALLTNTPVNRNWGIVSQFISLYQRVLVEAKVS